jgi:hypothetical protein
MDAKAQELFAENSYLFDKFKEFRGKDLISLNDTSYFLSKQSIYSFI